MKSFKNPYFNISERKILLRIIDFVVVATAIFSLTELTELFYFSELKYHYYWLIVLFFYTNIFGTIFELYNLNIASYAMKSTKGIILTAVFTCISFIITPFVTPLLPEKRVELLLLFGTVLVALSIWRIIYVYLLANRKFYKNIILVCKPKDFLDLSNGLRDNNPHLFVKGFLSFHQNETIVEPNEIDFKILNQFIEVNQIKEIVVAEKSKDADYEVFTKLLEITNDDIEIFSYPEMYENLNNRVSLHNAEKIMFNHFPYSKKHNKLYLALVRVLDVSVSIFGLFIFVLLLPPIAVLNMFFNKGPLFFKQERVGKREQLFELVKLRTMVTNAEKDGAVFASKNDHRITPLGKWLRRTRLDEVPQFINVLKGEMSLIGPRPERKIFVDQIAEKLPLYHARHSIKPGLTGWAQINYPYGENLEDSFKKLEYDLFYVKRRSIFLDFNIVIKTIGTIIYLKGK